MKNTNQLTAASDKVKVETPADTALIGEDTPPYTNSFTPTDGMPSKARSSLLSTQVDMQAAGTTETLSRLEADYACSAAPLYPFPQAGILALQNAGAAANQIAETFLTSCPHLL
jgi:hypothetical protein